MSRTLSSLTVDQQWTLDQVGNWDIARTPGGVATSATLAQPAAGTVDGADSAVMLGAYSGSWNDADLDNDGDVDAADQTLLNNNWGATLGWGALSQNHNRLGYAGYVFDEALAGTKWHVRHRVLESVLGRWISRDPLGYVEDYSLLEYLQGIPHQGVDPAGLYPIPIIIPPWLFNNCPSHWLRINTVGADGCKIDYTFDIRGDCSCIGSIDALVGAHYFDCYAAGCPDDQTTRCGNCSSCPHRGSHGPSQGFTYWHETCDRTDIITPGEYPCQCTIFVHLTVEHKYTYDGGACEPCCDGQGSPMPSPPIPGPDDDPIVTPEPDHG